MAGIELTPKQLAKAVAGRPYSQQLNVVGGTAPYSWSLTGHPSWLSIDSNGILSGTPTQARTTSFTVDVRDSQSSVSQKYDLVVEGATSAYWNLTEADARIVASAMAVALVLGCIVAAIGAWYYWLEALMWAGACSAVGWIGGFLFGIPRSLASDDQPVPMAQAVAAAAPGGEQQNQAAPVVAGVQQGGVQAQQGGQNVSVRTQSSVRVNTNLEQISDWLTKIIVGVTLVQLRAVLTKLNDAATTIAASLGSNANRISFAYALMLYFSMTGFLGSYLLTRLFLQRAFRNVDTG
ncbi:MAG: putative Ig domain-containing protein [Acidobacteriaceae bacterium]|nr:putative Ig domain-containing protein [Acidobacteriaceae bacterium]MBV9779996.1 putative Ig domain-containing protein [Acidobacteriaceae bacterium]